MDLRVQKTEHSIREEYVKLREKKLPEKITVKELCEKAMINKATFYLHYKSIYELSEALEDELIESCFATIPDEDIRYVEKVVIAFYNGFAAKRDLFRTLFSGSRIEFAAKKTDAFLKERIYRANPALVNDLDFNIRFTAVMYGCFYAYSRYKDADTEVLAACLAKFARQGLS